jgi:membrane-bound ClpP family serine protease
MNPYVWVFGLLVIGLLVMVLEVFIPSGGLLGFISIAAIVAAVATAFAEQGIAAGLLVLAVTAVAVPATLAIAFHLFPATPLGRRILPAPPEAAELVPAAAERLHARELIGHRGVVTSELMPWGQAEIDGERLEALSQSGPIAVGAVIDVVGTEGRAVVVRMAREEPHLRAFTEPVDAEAAAPTPPQTAEKADPRSVTLEEFEFDDLDRPAGA